MADDAITKLANISQEARQKAAKSGKALTHKDGSTPSYPIRNVADLKNAIQAFGRAKDSDKPRLKAFIKKRARELGHPELIPDSWSKQSVSTSNTDLLADGALNRLALAVEASETSETSALERLELTRVVVPRHTRKNPKTGKTEDVDTYTYDNSKQSLGSRIRGVFGRHPQLRGPGPTSPTLPRPSASAPSRPSGPPVHPQSAAEIEELPDGTILKVKGTTYKKTGEYEVTHLDGPYAGSKSSADSLGLPFGKRNIRKSGSARLAVETSETSETSALERLELAAVGTLDWSPKKNWVDQEGGLPKFIEDMALHMMQNSGLSRTHAIAASVQRTKVLAAKGNRRAIQALAEWERKKASAKAKPNK